MNESLCVASDQYLGEYLGAQAHAGYDARSPRHVALRPRAHHRRAEEVPRVSGGIRRRRGARVAEVNSAPRPTDLLYVEHVTHVCLA